MIQLPAEGPKRKTLEPITHLLTGACLGRSGFNRKTAYATLAMTLAAEAPDIDILWRWRGPVAALEHHRGITHTLIAAPVIALFVTGTLWGIDRLWDRLFQRYSIAAGDGDDAADPRPTPRPPQGFTSQIVRWFARRKARRQPEQPVRWPLVWTFSLLAVLSHLLLDYTNNYGIRPFFPFSPRWYSWDIVFVIEPVMLAALGLGLVMPALFGLADREMGVRRTRFRGRGWAIAALVSIVLLYALRNAEHAHALQLVRNANITTGPITRVGIEPYPLDPFKWFAVMQTADYYQTAVVNTRTDTIDTEPGQTIYKPAETAATRAAKASWLGHAYLDWAGFPVVTDRGNAANLPHKRGIELPPPQQPWTAVEFEDLRFAYPALTFAGFNRGDPPLSGWVYVGPAGMVEATSMDGRAQK